MPESSPRAIVINLSTSGSRLGGAATAAEWHSRVMANHFPVELWRMWDNNDSFAIDKLNVRNYKSFVPGAPLSTMLPRSIQATFLESRILADILQSHADIIHLQNPLPARFYQKVVKAAARSGKCLVTSTHGFFEIFNPNYNLNPLQKLAWQILITKPIQKALPLLDFVFAGYPDEKQFLTDLGVPADNISIIPNGINPYFQEAPTIKDCETVRHKFKINTKHPILLFIGNHTKNKGLDTVIKVASQLQTPATFVIGGKLLHPQEEKGWKEQYPIASNVDLVFTDYLSLQEQRALYYLADILLFPSLADTLPLTILEAMAFGLPVIAYDLGGISYQLMNQSGVLVPAGNFEAYYKTTTHLLRSAKLRAEIGEKAKARQRLFSWEEAARQTIGVYEKLLHLS